MGTTEDRDWVSVANDLLRSCHINQHIKHLSECGADVFVHLYESILREKVPDLIATPRSQEDDAHNVQAVIDSLALDYLQVSLSHITGENIVKGEKESIRNLLEIFDGLLEYLTEEDSESQDGVQKRETETGHGEGQEEGEEGTSVAKLEEANVLSSHEIQTAAQERLESNAGQLNQPSIFSSGEGSQSEFSVPSCDVDGSESTSELIRLGDTAYSFSKREEEFKWPELLPAGKDKGVETSKHSEAFTTFPRQFSETERVTVKEKEDGSMESVHATEPQTEILSVSATKLREPIQQAIPLLPPFQPSEGRPHYPGWRDFDSSASQSAALAESQGVTASTLEKSFTEKADDVSGSPFLSRKIPVREEVVSSDAEDNVAKVPHISETSASASSSHQKLSLCAEQVEHTLEPWYLPRSKSRHEGSTTDSLEESLSHRTTKEKLSEQELHEVSENISHRLNELDLMLKRALGGHTREEELTDEDNLSQHSDSVMDYRWRKAERDTPHLSRPRSLSPASPSSQHQLFSDLGGKPSIKGTSPIRKIRSQLQKEQDERTKNAKMVAKAYEDELRIYKARERLRLSKLRDVTKEMEQEYKENIFKEPPKMPQPVKVYSRKTTPRNPKYSQWIPKRGTVKPKKAAPIKGRGDDLLHQLLEEFPHLHISRHTMNKMWQQQLAHTGQLKAASDRNRGTLQNEVQQALKKHELLVAIIKKDQDHNKRLQELKQRICRQKWAQNKVREKRQQVARARKYYEDYRVQLRAKMMRARTREERIFKNLFEEGLEIQRQRLKDLRAYAKEKRAEQRREHQNELESMENYYKDQFSMLAEALSQERQEIQTREKAQAQMLQKTKRELRSRMEKEIQQLQAAIMQSDDDTFFQELEADRLKSRLQMVSFQYSKSHFL